MSDESQPSPTLQQITERLNQDKLFCRRQQAFDNAFSDYWQDIEEALPEEWKLDEGQTIDAAALYLAHNLLHRVVVVKGFTVYPPLPVREDYLTLDQAEKERVQNEQNQAYAKATVEATFAALTRELSVIHDSMENPGSESVVH